MITDWAIFGGSFDPPHVEHLKIVQHAIHEYGLQKVLVVPCKYQCNKLPAVENTLTRYEMALLAFQGVSQIEVSNLQTHNKVASFTYALLKEIKQIYQFSKKPWLLVGSDVFVEIETWYKYTELPSLCKILLAVRGNSENLISRHNFEIGYLNYRSEPVSSSEIRKNISKAFEKGLLSEIVYKYIRQHNLYK